MIAILTNNIEFSLNVLKHEGSLKEYSPATRKGVFTSDREFRMVTERLQLEGVRLSDYRIIGSKVGEDLVAAAKARMNL